MNNVVCIKHPQYDGATGSPVLSCKTCCSFFIENVKLRNAMRDAEIAARDEQREFPGEHGIIMDAVLGRTEGRI